MSTTIKFRNHYIWKQYLKSWYINEQLAFLTPKKKSRTSSVQALVKQDYFYQLQYIQKSEDSYIKYLLKFLSGKRYNFYLKYYNCFKDALQQDNKHNFIRTNLLEEFHAQVESKMVDILPELIKGNFSVIDSDENFIRFMTFIGHQAVRTKHFKENTINKLNLLPRFTLYENFKNEDDVEMLMKVFNKHWWFFSFVLGQTYSFNLVQDREIDTHIPLFNNTEIPFLTSDSPIVSLKSITGNGSDLYLPISPKFGYVVLRDINTKFFNETCTSNDVNLFNTLIVENSYETYFSDSVSSIDKYRNLFLQTH